MSAKFKKNIISLAIQAILLTVSALLFITTELYRYGLIDYRVYKQIPLNSIQSEQGLAFITDIEINSNFSLRPHPKIQIYENGHSFGVPDVLHETIRKSGGGLFSHWGSQIYFSTPDNSSPLSNGRKYSYSYSPPIPLVLPILVALTFFVLWIPLIRRAIQRILVLHPLWLTTILVIIASTYRGLFWFEHPNPTFGGHMVKGMPFSDGRGWDTLAALYSEGALDRNGAFGVWGARRPLYYVFFGTIYALVGLHLWVIQLVKFFMSMVAVFFVFDATRRLVCVPVGIVAALVYIFSEYEAYETLMTRSEGLGAFFTNFSCWLLVVGSLPLIRGRNSKGNVPSFNNLRFDDTQVEVGLEGSPPRSLWRRLISGEGPSYFYLGASGVTLALANLARPLNLGAAVIVPFLLILVGAQSWRTVLWQSKKMRLISLVLPVACLLAVAPWLVRQWTVWGILSISDNSAEAILAASSPQYVTWSGVISGLYQGDPSDLGTRYRFFQDLMYASIRENTNFYFHNILKHAWLGMVRIPLPYWSFVMVIGAVIAMGLGSMRCSYRFFWSLVISVSFVLVSFYADFSWDSFGLWLWLSACVIGILIRSPVILLLGYIVPSIATMGLCAIVDERLYNGLTWQVAALMGWLIWHGPITLGNWTRQGMDGATLPAIEPNWGNCWAKYALYSCLLVLVGMSVGTFIVLYRFANFSGESSFFSNTPIEQEEWISRTLADSECEITWPLKDILHVHVGKLRSGYQTTFGPGEHINHWSGVFKPRPYGYTVVEMLPQLTSVYGVIPLQSYDMGDLVHVVVGVRRLLEGEQTFEVINFFALDANGDVKFDFHCNYRQKAAQTEHLKLLFEERENGKLW